MSLTLCSDDHKMLIRIALVISFIQFTNALEYMVFNPIFLFMADDFSVPVSFSGYVSGMYTLGAVLSGIAAFYGVNRLNKKRFLFVNMALLGTLTLLTTFTTHFNVLLVLRFCAGLVGGTTMGVGISILINHAPAPLRGKMLATVIAAFSLISIVGMPAILFLCTHYGWHVALWLIALLCLLALPLIVFIIPQDAISGSLVSRLSLNADTLLFAGGNALVQFSPMLIIPVLVPLMTQRMGVSPDTVPWLFFAAGIAGYLCTKLTGRLTVHLSALVLMTVSTIAFVLSLLIPALDYQNAPLFILVFIGASYSRLVSSSAVTIQFPDDKQRAGFSSLQTAIMFLATTLAFFLSSWLVPVQGMSQNPKTLWVLCAVVAACAPVLVMIQQKKLAKRANLQSHSL